MDVCRAEDGILIVSNFYRLSDNINNLSFDVININTGKVVGTNLEYISGMNEYKYNANMYEELTDEQYKEILSSLGYEFINTYLYEKHYKWKFYFGGCFYYWYQAYFSCVQKGVQKWCKFKIIIYNFK